MGDIMAGISKPVNGVGIKGRGSSCKNGQKKKSYTAWCRMLQRCYSDEYQSRQPTYIGCSVSEEWKSYVEFEKWFDVNYIDGYHLDKDIIEQGNKIYCKEYCAYVPQRINNLLCDRARLRGKYPLGVTLHNQTGLYDSRATFNGKTKRFGLFKTIKQATPISKERRA